MPDEKEKVNPELCTQCGFKGTPLCTHPEGYYQDEPAGLNKLIRDNQKPAYELTLDQFRNEVLAGKRNFQLPGPDKRQASDLVRSIEFARKTEKHRDIAEKLFADATLTEHRALILEAFVDELPVPDEVLDEYQDYITD